MRIGVKIDIQVRPVPYLAVWIGQNKGLELNGECCRVHRNQWHPHGDAIGMGVLHIFTGPSKGC